MSCCAIVEEIKSRANSPMCGGGGGGGGGHDTQNLSLIFTITFTLTIELGTNSSSLKPNSKLPLFYRSLIKPA